MKLRTQTIAFQLALVFTGIALAAINAQASVTLVSTGAVWKYLDNGSDQGTAWRELGFDDSTWASGPGELGYGDGDEATTVSYGPDSNNKYVTTYFRHAFTVANPSALTSLLLRVRRDDGAVAYLNGTEVFRSNLPGGTITSTTPASSALGGADETVFVESAVSLALLNASANVLAVEIHQANGTSSDISFDLEFIGGDGSATVTRGPYLQMGTPTSVVLRWRTDVATDSQVRVSTDGVSWPITAGDPTVTTEHIVTVSGLQPSTQYFYEIGTSSGWFSGDSANDFFVTSPPTGNAIPTRLWVIGDSGTADANAAAVRNAYLNFAGTRHTDLWLMLGDNAYNNGTDAEYQAAVFAMYPTILQNTVLWSTRGNHESDVGGGGTTYYSIFSLPTNGEAGGVASGTEAYYSFDYGNIHFICLDSQGSSRAANGPMATWLANDLMATTQDWIIAFWHHPPYTKGSHNSDTESQLVDMRQNFLPILEAGGVDLVLCGHSHSYERSFLLDSHYGTSSTLNSSSMILDGGSGQEENSGAYQKATLGPASHEGTVYVVAGSSGQASGGSLNHPAMFISLNNLGSLVLDVDGNRLDARFLRENGATPDHFTIIKGSGPTVPAAPANLVAVAGNQQVALSWNGSASAESYLVYRSDDGGNNFTNIANPTGTSYTDTGLANETTYFYLVTAINGIGESADSNVASATPSAFVDAFANADLPVAGTVTGSYLETFSTDNVYQAIREQESGGKPSSRYSYLEHKWTFQVAPGDSITFYLEAYRSANSEGDDFDFAYSQDDSNYTNMLTVNQASDDNTYQTFSLPSTVSGLVYVRVKDKDRTAGRNALDTVYIDHMFFVTEYTGNPTVPLPPTDVMATAGDNQVVLSWAPSSGATSYTVQRGTIMGNYDTTFTENITTTAFTDTTAVNGTTYYYVVIAVNALGSSDRSEEVSATPAAPSLPEAPTNLVASPTGKRKIMLSWSQSTTPDVTQNVIHRAANSGGPYTSIATIPANTTYQDSGLTSGATYFYVITAANAAGPSDYSNESSATAR